MDSQDKKVDSSWKEQVKQEKSGTPAEEERDDASEGRDTANRALPPPDLSALVTGMALQTLVALGEVKTREGEDVPPDLPQAKHLIDTLDMLKKKTEGNLTPEEQAQLLEWCYRLHMAYAEKVQRLTTGEGETT